MAIDRRGEESSTREALHRSLYETSPDMIPLVLANGEIHDRNEAARGLGSATHLDQCFEHPGKIQDLLQRGFVASGEQELSLNDGRVVLMSTSPLALDQRQGFQCVLRDVTTYRLLAGELRSES